MFQEYFNLSENPFTIHPNTQFYCELKCHEEALHTIIYSIQNQDSLIKITGEVGLGKSMVAACLREKLKPDYHVCEIRNPNLNSLELIYSLGKQLEINKKDVHGNSDSSIMSLESLKKLEEKLVFFHKKKRPVILIIDEAQAMEDALLETLRLLTNLELDAKPLLQIVLFGQEELDIKLDQPKFRQIKQRICFSYKIRPLSANEVNVYINGRLGKAGSERRQVFSNDALNTIAKYSRGIPRNINIIAQKSMMFAVSGRTFMVEKDHVWKALRDHNIISKSSLDWKNILVAFLFIINILIVYSIVSMGYPNILNFGSLG